ncbi:Hypothetical_protein [Hexamita inflata]|uniref:Hypothetical_protein n=1 Tax=Hexamita inflata TaxID=28002 RepID=A0AA86U7B0_9EUKA|nr:Hypothetical protein HINF_LOCUS20223 [Hexamita inflata]
MIYHFFETAQTDFIETFESKTQALARPYFHFQNEFKQSFMPTQQRPNRVLTESSADQFYLIRQLNLQKLVLASQFLFARYFLRLVREVVPLYWHCLVLPLMQLPKLHQNLNQTHKNINFHQWFKLISFLPLLTRQYIIHKQIEDQLLFSRLCTEQ